MAADDLPAGLPPAIDTRSPSKKLIQRVLDCRAVDCCRLRRTINVSWVRETERKVVHFVSFVVTVRYGRVYDWHARLNERTGWKRWEILQEVAWKWPRNSSTDRVAVGYLPSAGTSIGIRAGNSWKSRGFRSRWPGQIYLTLVERRGCILAPVRTRYSRKQEKTEPTVANEATFSF